MSLVNTLLSAGPQAPAAPCASYVAESPAMQRIASHARVVAASSTPVIIVGEPGTGKEYLARCLHDAGWRASGRFVTVACARLGQSVEAAVASAAGGTLVLDEVTDLSLTAQMQLVRLLREDWSARPVRGARVIATTSADLEQRIDEGTFRADLFYRLSVARFHLPALRDRSADIVPLAELFLARFCATAGVGDKVLDADAIDRLLVERWSTNIDGLKRAIDQAAETSGDAPVVLAEDLPHDVGQSAADDRAAVRPYSTGDVSRAALPVTPVCHAVQVPAPGVVGPRPAQLWACQYPYPTLRASGPDESCGDCPIWPVFQQVRAGRRAVGGK
jgi:DNA-binding NtrC family response regulator